MTSPPRRAHGVPTLPASILGHSPRFEDHRRHARAVIDAVLRAADPAAAVTRALRAEPPANPILGPIAVGKAALAMLEGFLSLHPETEPTAFAIVPAGAPVGMAPIPRSRLREADHPIPTERNAAAASDLLKHVESLRAHHPPDARLTLLLSGGASALLTLPVTGVSLRDLAELTRALLRAGAPIDALNAVRKHLEQLKGGRLAQFLAPIPIDAYLLSDVVGDDPSVIGSGPAAPDPSTFADALAVLDRFGVRHVAPAATAYLEAGVRGQNQETPKPGSPIFERSRSRIIASNAAAVDAACRVLLDLGFSIAEVRHGVTGEARDIGRWLGHAARDLALRAPSAPPPPPSAIVLGGETTVTVRSPGGFGGRNRELALAAAVAIADLPRAAVFTFATDGIDGVHPPGAAPAAGALVTGATVPDARRLGLDPHAHLAGSNTHLFFESLGANLYTGPTGTNVNDIAVALVY